MKTKIGAVIGIIAVFVSVLVMMSPKAAVADQYDEQIAALKKKVQEMQAAADSKASEASSLNAKIASIDAEIIAAQHQLDLTNLEIRKTQSEIEKNNREMERQKEILRDNLRMIYRQGNISPLEVIASSKNLSDFVAQQQYLSAIKEKVNENIDKIDALKKELDRKKGELNSLALQQKGNLDSIESQKIEKAELLEKTKGEEAAYQKIVADSKRQLQGIYAERASRDAAKGIGVSTGGTGGYPFANGPRCSVEGCVDDGYSYFQRQCTSYAAWKYRLVHGTENRGWGNAFQWKSHANSKQPVAGAIVVWDAYSEPGIGWAGHVAYVESVNENGTMINVSEYNWRPEIYSYRTGVPVHDGMYFIK
jgi:peptidoglycan hydrolase CwlO-like protein